MNNLNKKAVADILKENMSFIILPHISPDADAIGSCYAMKRILEHMGKSAGVCVQESIPEYLSFIPGEAVLYEQIPKDGKYDVCLCIDCGDIKRVDRRAELFDRAKISVNVDHHYSNTNYADVNFVDADACSAGEICFGIIKELHQEIDTETAVCLYSAICGDTGGFRYSNTTPATMRIAAELLEKKIDSAKINRLLFDCENFDTVRLKGEIGSRAELFFGGLIGTACVDKNMLEKYGVEPEDADNIVDIVRRIKGVEVAVSFKESDIGIKISLRSNDRIDVSKIAAKFGGGGHIRASGVLMKCGMDEAKERIIKAITEEFDEQGKKV